MTQNSITKTVTFALTLALTAGAIALGTTTADAGGKGKDIFVQDYKFDKAMHGYEGHAAGGYYCSYQRLPDRKCTYTASGKEICKVVGWTLRQRCY